MSTISTAPRAGPSTATARRARFASMAGVLFLAVSASLILLNILASRAPIRADVTATGEHKLSPRTIRVLQSLAGDCRIVIAAPFKSIDRAALERVRDVLAQFQRTSPRIKPAFIDTGSAAGVTQYTTFLRDLIAADGPALESQARTLRDACASLESLAADLETNLSASLLKAREALPPGDPAKPAAGPREAFEQRAAAARIAARDLRRAAADAQTALANTVGDVPLPATDKATSQISTALASVVDQLSTLAQELKAFSESDASPPAARDAAKSIAPATAARRDSAALLREQIARLAKPDVLRIADALKSSTAVLIMNSGAPSASGASKTSGLTAVDPAALFPASLALHEAGLAQADLRRRSEELLSTAIATLINPARPIVVFTHAEARAFLDKSPIFPQLLEHLRVRGIDAIEWPVVLNPDPPALAALDPDRKRPVVFLSIAPNTSPAAGSSGEASGAERAAKLGQALDRLAQRGDAILLSINPSLLPSYGQADPTTAILPLFGLQADSGRPLMREVILAQGRAVQTDDLVRPPTGDHPILRAVASLPTYLTWPISLSPAATPPSGITTTPLAIIADSPSVWAESQWLNVWQTPAEQRAYLRNPPTFDPTRDARGGPWTVAAAAERTTADGKRQRLIAVGSNTWFTDPIASTVGTLDGRTFNPYPGNLELFDAGIYWLCGQDDLIAQTPAARAVPIVKDIPAPRLAALRWAATAGLPLLILILGLLHRALRG